MGGVPRRPGPPSPDRRRVVLALGFGALNAAALSQLPARGTSGPRPILGDRPSTDELVAPPSLADAGPEPAAGTTHELVISGGRVIDPDSGFDAIANVAVDGERITAISREPLVGTRTIDASDRVVTPGFIDILSYEPNNYGIWYKVADGVTTNLGMHGINATAAEFFARFANEGSPCHYGGAYDNPWHRATMGLEPDDTASAEQIVTLAADCRQQLADGWIGVDLEPEYTPGIAYEEMLAMAQVAAESGVSVYVHGRYSDNTAPGTNAETLEEILRLARDTGCGIHVEHLISTGGTFSMEESLATLDAAIAEGLAVTACMYPYDYWATYLGSARFAPGWQDRFGIDYGDLVVAGTGERVTEATFASLQAQNVLVAAYAIPEDDVVTCMRSPFVMIGSDGILEPGDNNHPRGAGCFTRVLGRYVREEEVLDLVDGIAKMTIQPARRFEGAAPVMARKGRLQRGADADIVVFDPATVADTSTVEDPSQFARGIDWVLVLGTPVQTPGGVQVTDALVGRPINSTA
jgi:N-acyl-D-aspartate/D-glutamate deacylase